MEELDVMVRSGAAVPRQRTAAARQGPRAHRVRGAAGRVLDGPAVAAGRPRRSGSCRTAPRGLPAGAAELPAAPTAPVRRAPARAGAALERVPRARACVVAPRGPRPGPRGGRTRAERFLVGMAAVLCSAVVVVVLGLVADASAGRSDATGGATAVTTSPVPVSPVPVSPVSVSPVPAAGAR